MSSLLLKSMIDAVSVSALDALVSSPLTYLLMIGGTASAFAQIILLNYSLKHFSAIATVPIYESASILHNVLSGGLVFNEFV